MEIKEFVEWLWDRLAQFPGQNPIVIHKSELEEGLETWLGLSGVLHDFGEKGGKEVESIRVAGED